jgi:tRNA-Thr(GGU) m(6)t(6)A37 methyltransferase TsaA
LAMLNVAMGSVGTDCGTGSERQPATGFGGPAGIARDKSTGKDELVALAAAAKAMAACTPADARQARSPLAEFGELLVTSRAAMGDGSSGSKGGASSPVLDVASAPRGSCAAAGPAFTGPPPAPPARAHGGDVLTAGGDLLCAPIGHLRTCFVEKNGTPRQPCLCPSSAATLRLKLGQGLNNSHALEGLESFSHVWLFFVFHLNGNTAAKSKVHPPRLDGGRVGLFATRTPHRPNPIGLSLVRLEAVRGDTLHLSGIDLVDGTPILDVKPYIPFCDGHSLMPPPSVAPWIENRPTADLEVKFTSEAEEQLLALAPSLRLLDSASQARAALTEVLTADPRSVHWRQRRTDVEYGFSIDCLNAVVTFVDDTALVTQVQHIDLCDRSHVGGAAGAASSTSAQ